MKRLVAQGLIIAWLLAGCQSPAADRDAKPAPSASTKATDFAATTAVQTSTSTSKSAALTAAHDGFTTPPPAETQEQSKNPKPAHPSRFDIAVSNQEVHEFFYGLMQTMGKNIVVHPDVTGNVSLFLQNVTLEEALTAVNDMYGYDYERNDYGYVILPAVMNTRVFAIDYPNVERKGSSHTRVSSGEVTSTKNQDNAENGSSKSTSTDTVKDSTSIETSNNNDFWKELQNMLKLLVDSSKGGMVMINAQSGLVVVRGMPHELRSVETFLKRAQLSLDRQVVLEAKILEVTLRDRFQAGINWTALGELNSGSNSITGALSSETLANPDLIGGVFGVTVKSNDFNTVIELLQTQGDVSVLSSPRVATVNNQKAAIKVGTDEFFVTNVKSTTTTGTATTQTPEVTLTPFFSGIVLDVTPQISGGGDVVLHVHPSVSDVRDQKKDIQIGDQNLSLPLALSSIRETDSVVRARSRQVVLIGGLMSDNKNDLNAKVPWLADVPGFGWLFTQQRKDHLKSELVILLRPIIADADQALPHGATGEKLQQLDAGFNDGPWLQPAH